MDKIKSILRMKYLPEVLFLSLFFFSYAPHFIYCWYPQILNDTFAYMFQAKDIYEWKLPFKGHRMDLPYAYSIIIALIFKLGGSLKTIVLVQTVICAGAFLFLIRTFKKYNQTLAVFVSVVLWLYVSSTQSLLWNTLIYTESIYCSNIVFATSFILLFLKSRNKLYIYLLACCLVFGFMLRTNGLYLFFIPVVLILISWKTEKQNVKHVVWSVVLALFISSCFNSVFKDTWLPSETLRIVNKISGNGEYYGGLEKGPDFERNQKEYDKVFRNAGENVVLVERYRLNQTWKLLTHLSNSNFGNHYYYRMPRQIKQYDKEGILNTINGGHYVLRYKTVFDSPEEHAEFFLTNDDGDDVARKSALDVLDINKKPRNLWLLMNHIIDLALPFTRNFITVIFFYLSLLWAGVLFVKSDNRWFSPWFTILFIAGVHLFSIAFLGLANVSDNAYPRYAYVTEFIGFVVPVMFAFFLFQEKKYKNSSNNLTKDI